MKRNKSIWLFFFCTIFCACDNSQHSRLPQVPHMGERVVQITDISLDSLTLDAHMTSLAGKWYLHGDTLVLLDKYAVSMQKYDLSGQYIGKMLVKGRGPNEQLEPFYWFQYTDDGGFYAMNTSWQMFHYSANNVIVGQSTFLENVDIEEYKKIYANPDPKSPSMYEPQTMCSDMGILGDNLVFPVVTEHYLYNGYESRTKDYYRNSHLFAAVDTSSLHIRSIFGFYPQIFQKSNIPNFATLRFSTDSVAKKMYVSFYADPKVYVYNNDFELIHTFGERHDLIKGDYPSTSTFEEADELSDNQYKRYGYYDRIAVAGDYVFRSYKTDNGKWGMMAYETSSGDQIADFSIQSKEFRIIGYHKGWYYAEGGWNYDKETCTIYKFKI